jgi:16S rRNA processing protein RimM
MGRQTPTHLAIAQIDAPWGVRGEVKAEILTDFPDRFAKLTIVYLGDELTPFDVERTRQHKGAVIMKFKGCDNRSAAEVLRRKIVHIPIEEAMPLREGQYYVHQIVGLEAWTTGGEWLGEVVEVLFTGGNDVYVVRREHGELLIPAIAKVIKQVDLVGGRLVVETEGLEIGSSPLT